MSTTIRPAVLGSGGNEELFLRPVAAQALFAGLVAVDAALRALAGGVGSLVTGPVLGTVLAVVGLGLALAVDWERLPGLAVAALPVLDIAATGVSRLGLLNVFAGLLVIVPGYWLGRLLGRLGILVTVVVGLAVVTLPGLLFLERSGNNILRSFVLVGIGALAAWAAQAIGSTLEQLHAERTAAEEDRDRLAGALDFIEHQGRVNQAILETVDVGLLLLDSNGNYQSMNRRHRVFMEVAFPDGHLGRVGQVGMVFDETGEHQLSGEEMPTTRAARGEEFDDVRIWVGEDPTSVRAMSVSARSVRGEDGSFRGAALAFNDVTDYMRALRVKDEFVASVSHELRTPLTSIRGYVDLMLDEPDLPPEIAQMLTVVVRNSERLGRLVADLLQSAQIDAGPMQVVRQPGDLADVVRDTVAAAGPVAETNGIELVSEVPESLEMSLDLDRMRQVADNLVSNALKYTLRGGQVRVGLAVDGDRAELSVSDTGIGIDARDRDRLFTRFFRTRDAEEQRIQGVGLGLSITKSIVESHGGRIEVDSEVGQGSTFRVRLPLGAGAP